MTLTWRGRLIENVEPWYNITSGRHVTITTRKDLRYLNVGKVYLNSDGPCICGTPPDIEEFIRENKLGAVTRESKWKWITSLFTSEPTLPNPCKLSQSEKAELCCFSFENLCGPGEIRRVIDGDTYEIDVFIPLMELTKKITYGREREARKRAHFNLPFDPKLGFYTTLTCRINGVDAAESDTVEGQLATKLMIQYFKSLKNQIYYRISHKADKCGRTLMDLYSDPQMKVKCMDHLLTLKTEDGRPIAMPYDGGTKSKEMTSLPKVKKTTT